MIKIPALLKSCRRLADRSLAYKFDTTLEGSQDDLIMGDDYTNQVGWLIFSPNNEIEVEIPVEDAPSELKSHSKRLRNVLYVLWVQKGQKDDYSTFYTQSMEKIINSIKDRLED